MAKYDPLQRRLEAAPPDELVSLSFDEINRLVGVLPPNSWTDRTWWGNTTHKSRSQAKSWMATGRRVVELRLGEVVVFSPADAIMVPEGSESGHTTGRTWALPSVMDGIEALDAVVGRAGYPSVAAAVAAHTLFLHPGTVAQIAGQPLFRTVRDPARRGAFGALPDGTEVMFDDNTTPTLAFLWSAQRVKGPDVQFNHVWGDPRNPATYTALWNLCATPAFLAKTTDGSNHPEVLGLLRYRAFDLFNHFPRGEEQPVRPPDYEDLVWLEPPDPVDDLEAVLRARLASSPKSRAAAAVGRFGWPFTDWGPELTIAHP
jgi:hypothetical protein